MWLLPEQIEGLLAAAGLAAAPAPARGELRVAVGVEPASGSARLEAGAAEGAPPGPEAAVDVDVRYGLWEAHARELLGRAGRGEWSAAGVPAILALWRVFQEVEALRIEAELARVGAEARLVRARALCDDNALFRNERLARLAAALPADPARSLAAHGVDLVELQGEVGLVSVGAGETMAAMDLLESAGSRAACFLDVSGGFGPEAVTAALRHASALPGVRAVLVNVFGGLTRVDRVAESILEALDRLPGFSLPLVVRLEGTEAERGRDLLAGRGIRSRPELREAIESAAALARGGAS